MRRLSWHRFASVFIAGLGIFGLVMGSVLLAQMDPAMVVQQPTRGVNIPTPTLYPTLALETPTAGVTPDAAFSPTPETPGVNPCAPPPGWVQHEVRSGETLFALAVVYGTNVYALMQANCLETADIAPGQMLYLPPLQATPTAYHCSGPPPTWRVAYVQRGDTLYSLALQYGTNVEAIRRANCMADSTLYAGQPLYLPPVIVITLTPTFVPPTPVDTPTWTPESPTPQITLTPTSAPTVPVTMTATPTPAPPSPTLTAPPASSTPTLTPPVTSTLPPPLTPTPEPTLSLTPTPEPLTVTPTPGTPTVAPTSDMPTATPTFGTPTATEPASATDTPTPDSPTATTEPNPPPTATFIPTTQAPPTPTATAEATMPPSPTPGE